MIDIYLQIWHLEYKGFICKCFEYRCYFQRQPFCYDMLQWGTETNVALGTNHEGSVNVWIKKNELAKKIRRKTRKVGIVGDNVIFFHGSGRACLMILRSQIWFEFEKPIGFNTMSLLSSWWTIFTEEEGWNQTKMFKRLVHVLLL